MKSIAQKRNANPPNNRADTRYYFFSCPALDLWSVGATRKEAERRLRDE
jgi:hypothetical protein